MVMMRLLCMISYGKGFALQVGRDPGDGSGFPRTVHAQQKIKMNNLSIWLIEGSQFIF